MSSTTTVQGTRSYHATASDGQHLTVATLTALCLVAGMAVFFHFHSEVGEEIAFLAITVPVLLQIWLGRTDIRVALRTFSHALPLLIAIWLSLAATINAQADFLRNLVILLNLTYAFVAFSILGSDRAADLWPDVMRVVFWLACPVFVYVLLVVPRDVGAWGRWAPFGIQPNWWGMMALGLAWSALAQRNGLIRFAGVALAAYFMFRVQSRGAMLALVPAVGLCSGYFLPLSRRRIVALIAITIFGATIVAVAMLSSDDFGKGILDFFVNDVARLNDNYRGLGSGMSGRTANYDIGWAAFLDAPFFGTGFRSLSMIHNGFLLVLAESGLVALLGMIFLFGWNLKRYIAARDWIGAGYIISYAVALMTFPRSLNINMTSLLCIMVLMNGVKTRNVGRPRLAVYPPSRHLEGPTRAAPRRIGCIAVANRPSISDCR